MAWAVWVGWALFDVIPGYLVACGNFVFLGSVGLI